MPSKSFLFRFCIVLGLTVHAAALHSSAQVPDSLLGFIPDSLVNQAEFIVSGEYFARGGQCVYRGDLRVIALETGLRGLKLHHGLFSQPEIMLPHQLWITPASGEPDFLHAGQHYVVGFNPSVESRKILMNNELFWGLYSLSEAEIVFVIPLPAEK